MELSPGDRIDKYTLVKLLGKGGMGDVWTADHHTLGRPVALKIISPARWLDEDGRDTLTRRFEREAQATCQLTSPHTIRVYDFGTTPDGAFFYAMELLDGLDLSRLVEQHGPVEVERAVWFLQQACDSLSEAHGGGLVHRDIKPANLFASRAGLKHDFIKVLDFGLVKSVDNKLGNSRLTDAGTTTGSPAFMAPELNLGHSVDHRADLYSLGCVAYWLVTGKLVFKAPNAMLMMMAHTKKVAPAPSAASELAIPREYDALVAACLSKETADRPAHGPALAELLAAVPLARPWTEGRAAAWWQDRLPAAQPVTRPHRPNPQPTGEGPIGPAQRDAAIAQLEAAFGRGDLDLSEYDARVSQATRAKHAGDLVPLTRDLAHAPAVIPTLRPHLPASKTSEKPRPLLAVFGSTRRKGSWRVPAKLRAVAIFGGIDLDLRHAELGQATEIRCAAVFGSVSIIVPPGIHLEVDGLGVFGGFDERNGATMSVTPPNAARVRVRGVAAFGNVDVKVAPRDDDAALPHKT